MESPKLSGLFNVGAAKLVYVYYRYDVTGECARALVAESKFVSPGWGRSRLLRKSERGKRGRGNKDMAGNLTIKNCRSAQKGKQNFDDRS